MAHRDGVYEFNVDNGENRILKSNNWGSSKKIMYYNGYLYIIDNDGFFKVDKNNGEYSKIGSGTWGWAIRNICVNFGSDFYVFYSDKIYWGSLENCSYSIINTSDWSGCVGVFKSSSDIKFPLTGGEWKSIFEVKNPLVEHVYTFKYKVGTTTTSDSEITDSFSSKLETSITTGIKGFGDVSTTMSVEFCNQVKKMNSKSFNKVEEKQRQIKIVPGKSV